MRTSWLKVLDQRLGYKPDPEKWKHNSQLAGKHSFTIRSVLDNCSFISPVERMRVYELLEWLEEHKPVEPVSPHEHLPGLLDWIESHPQAERTYVEGDNERHAGNGVPFIDTEYLIEGRTFRVSTYPDWDNYSQDCTIYMDDVPISIVEN